MMVTASHFAALARCCFAACVAIAFLSCDHQSARRQPSKIQTAPPESSTTVNSSDQPILKGQRTLFVKYGEVLVPLACWQKATGISSDCSDQASTSITVFPEKATVQARREVTTSEGSGKPAVVWVVEGSPSNALGRLEGLGLSGDPADVHVRKQALSQTLTPNAARVNPPPGVADSLRKKVMELLKSASLTSTVPIEIVDAVDIRSPGGQRRVYSVQVDTSVDRSERATSLELPSHIWFLFESVGDRIEHVVVKRDYDFGLGEGGKIIGIVDLDGDQNDELIVVWYYAGGEVVELLGRSRPTTFRRLAKVSQGS